MPIVRLWLNLNTQVLHVSTLLIEIKLISFGLTNQDLQAGSYLVKDYREIILSQDVLEKVVAGAG